MKKISKKVSKKVQSNKGYTLVELLTALIIVVLISMMISTGVTVGLRVQKESIFVANSDMLAGTLNTALSDVLRYSVCDFTNPDDLNIDGLVENPKFTNKEYSIKKGYLYVDDNGHMAVSKNGVDPSYVPDPDDPADPGPDIGYLVSDGVYSKKLIIEDFELTYDPVKKIYSGRYKIQQSNADNYNKSVSFTYRSIAK